MPIYKKDTSGKFVPFEETPFPDLENVLEDWIEASPHVVFGDEDIAIFARQPRTHFDKYLDLLGVDKTGATIVIELKRGETPRDVVAQTLEYAAWVDSLSLDQLDEMARDYSEHNDLGVQNLAGVYLRTFGETLEDAESESSTLAERITFNNRQRLVIVAERISDEVEQTLRYLRTRFGVDIYGVSFSVHKAGEDTLISTTTVVGRERASNPRSGQSPQRLETESDEHILAKVKTEFMRDAVSAIEKWVDEVGADGLSIWHSSGSEHYLRYLGTSWLYYYYANSWLYMSLRSAAESEVDYLRERLSKPGTLLTQENWNGDWRFHVATQNDLQSVKDIIVKRLESAS